MNTIILAQVFGLLGALSMLLSSWQKTRKKALSFLVLDCIFYCLQYILLGAFSGALANIVGLIRTLVFRRKNDHKILQTKSVLYIIIVIYILTGILTYDGINSIFPIVTSILYSITLWQDDIRKIRIGNAVMIFGWFIYNITVGAYLGAVIEGILLISSLMAIIKLDIVKTPLKQH